MSTYLIVATPLSQHLLDERWAHVFEYPLDLLSKVSSFLFFFREIIRWDKNLPVRGANVIKEGRDGEKLL